MQDLIKENRLHNGITGTTAIPSPPTSSASSSWFRPGPSPRTATRSSWRRLHHTWSWSRCRNNFRKPKEWLMYTICTSGISDLERRSWSPMCSLARGRKQQCWRNWLTFAERKGSTTPLSKSRRSSSDTINNTYYAIMIFIDQQVVFNFI